MTAPSFVARDPDSIAGRRHAAEIHKVCAQRGIGIYEHGRAYRLIGPGVHLVCEHLGLVSLSDLVEPNVTIATTAARRAT